MVELKGYWGGLLQHTLKDTEQAPKRLGAKYKCVVCGKDELSFVDVRDQAYFLKADGAKQPITLKYTEDLLLDPDNMIVCGDECRRAYVRAGKLSFDQLMMDIPIEEKFRGVSIEWWNRPDDKDYINVYKGVTEWLKTMPKGLYLYGPPGVGKSSLAVGILYELRKRELRATIADCNVLATEVNSGLYGDELKRFTAQFDKYDVVILDEMSKHCLTATGKELLFRVFAKLYNAEKIVLITSNYELDVVANAIDERLHSRLIQMCDVVGLNGDDKRKNGRSKNTSK